MSQLTVTAILSPKQARIAAGWSLDRAAVMADVSKPTARIYELDREAVSPPKRAQLDRIYASFDRRR